MPVPQRRFHGDEELGKKDDDHKPGSKGPMARVWQQRRLPNGIGPRRNSLKKIALGILVVIGLYYFFKNMPTDLKQPTRRPYYPPAGPNAQASKPSNNYDSTSKSAEEEDAPPHKYNGVWLLSVFVSDLT